MSITEFLGFFALFIEIVGGAMMTLELSKTFHIFISKENVNLSDSIKVQKIMTLLLGIVCNVAFILWLFIHSGFEHAWVLHIQGENLWSFILIFGLFKMSLASTFKSERTL